MLPIADVKHPWRRERLLHCGIATLIALLLSLAPRPGTAVLKPCTVRPGNPHVCVVEEQVDARKRQRLPGGQRKHTAGAGVDKTRSGHLSPRILCANNIER